MIASPQPAKMTVEAYLDWETRQPLRHEYINGETIAMTGGTLPHNDIALNFYTALRSHVRDRGCRINVADVKVQVTPTIYFYPDVVISYDPQDKTAIKLIQAPTLIVEVLSPGTAAVDRGDKFQHYRQLSSLQEYILINSEKINVECFRRGEGRLWLYTPYVAGETLSLESMAFSVAIDLLYEDVQLNP